MDRVLAEIEGNVTSYPDPCDELVERFSNAGASGLYLVASSRSEEEREKLRAPAFSKFDGHARVEYQRLVESPFSHMSGPGVFDLTLDRWTYEGEVRYLSDIWQLPSGRWVTSIDISTDCQNDIMFHGYGILKIIEIDV